MSSLLLRQILAVDPLRVAAACAHRPGTLLLHTQREWNGSGRSALLLDPRWSVHLRAGTPPRWEGTPPHPVPDLADPLRAMLRWTRTWTASPFAERGPLFAGLGGVVSYELGSAALGALRPGRAPFLCDDLWLAAWDCALVFGPGQPTELVVADLAPLVPRSGSLEDRAEQMSAQVRALAVTPTSSPSSGPGHAIGAGSVDLFDRAWHRRAVHRIHGHLRAGDCYQINLTGLASATTRVDPWLAFLDQAQRNPVAFAAYACPDPDTVITSHSPERLLRLRGSRADTAPIKGTHPAIPGAADTLRASEKDRAEHVMIVDLCRNDLGRHARAGSVRVESLFEPLALSRLVHMVSRISADYGPAPTGSAAREHALADLFPGGSITGAPKRRAAQIIAAIEPHVRGPYTGSIGFVDRAGYADWNIAIRTAVWQNDAVHFGCGGGIVLDSDPDREYEEAALKARSFFESLDRVADARAREESAP